jgi:hypothetical protein
VSTFPETENQTPMLEESPTGPEPWVILTIFVGVSLLLGLLLAIYVLAWDGGAHT